MSSLPRVIFLSVSICCMQAVSAQSLPDRMRECAAQSEATTRLDCYDQVAASLGQSHDKSAAATPADSAAPPMSTPAQSQFGIAGGTLERNREAGTPQQIEAVVAGVARRPRGELVVTLDNGQVWAQLQPQEYFPLKAGDTVHIAKGALGSYLLSTPAKRGAKVTRLL